MRRTILITTTIGVTGSVLFFGAVGTAVADVPVGPGPTDYTEQPQPAPGTCHYRTAANGETLPDPNCTPGAISPKVTDATLADTICKTGYTKSIGPPASITAAEKQANAAFTFGNFATGDFQYGIITVALTVQHHHVICARSNAVGTG
jgi:hypothetical protein